MTCRPPCSLRREHCLQGLELADRLGLSLQPGIGLQQKEGKESVRSMSIASHLHSSSADVQLCLETAAEGVFRNGGVVEESCGLGNRGKSIMRQNPTATGKAGRILGEETQVVEAGPRISLFEAVISTHPPVLESLLSQLPTVAILDLFHTSRYLRDFLASYPLAWKSLSFRLPQPAPVVGSPGNETPDGRERQSKQYALDGLLIQVVVPLGTRLRNLDLCNTAVSGVSLVSRVLQPRISMIQHLSVRGCKNVSIKYHLVPFLEPYSKKGVPWATKGELALKSLYAYRCRHHRRRPYLPQSLVRKDSDSEPTHQLIEICHELGIWTDTAWCPTPAGRCFRRKDYHNGRAAPGTPEVWVPFDRLWRSCNRIGPSHASSTRIVSDGRLWEDAETGYDGEALGPERGSRLGEGKDVPAHLRKSHKTFVENVKCTQCDEEILERCEQCSVRMHCMGCRKTLCASCAFNRPIPRKRGKTRHFTEEAFGNQQYVLMHSHQSHPSAANSSEGHVRRSASPVNDRFWWAPGATRSPNIMAERLDDGDSDSEDGGNTNATNTVLANNNMSPLKLSMHWCCLEPIFSGGGGITFLGNSIGGRGADKIRAAPLPRTLEYEDPEFSATLRSVKLKDLRNNAIYEHVLGEDMEILSFLTRDTLMLQESTCPRSLCQDCYRTFRWKVSCRGCKKPLCKEHDFRALKVRKCGFRDLQTERDFILNYKADKTELEIPAFKRAPPSPRPSEASDSSMSTMNTAGASSSENAGSSSAPSPPPHLNIPTQESNTATDMAASISSRGSAFDNNLESPFPVSTFTRPRSLSVSDLRHRVTSTSFTSPQRTTGPHARVPRPGHPRHPVQWEGCGAYFCQSPRAIGDSRMRCPATLKECRECGVYVCEGCMLGAQSCPCTYCSTNYHCPQCDQKPSIQKQCRLQEECAARLARQEAERRRMEHEREGAKAADELAAQLGEFFYGLFNDETPAVADTPSTDTTTADPINIDTNQHHLYITEDGEIGEEEEDIPMASEDQLHIHAQEVLAELDAALEELGGIDDDGGVIVDLDFTDVVDEDDDLDDFFSDA